jgi:hypothetical protein
MEGTVHAAMLSIIGRRASGVPDADMPGNKYALNPAFQYLQTWTPPVALYSENEPLTLGYDMIDWMAPGGGGEAENKVIGRMKLSRRRTGAGNVFLNIDYTCGRDRWIADVTCRDDRWCTPVEWTFRSMPEAPHGQVQNLVTTAFKGVRGETALTLTWTSGRQATVPVSGPLMFPFAMLACPEKWSPAAAEKKPVTAVRDLYHLLPDQRFVADGRVPLADGTSLFTCLQHGPGWVPANYVSGPTGLPLAMTGFLISYILTDAAPGGAA